MKRASLLSSALASVLAGCPSGSPPADAGGGKADPADKAQQPAPTTAAPEAGDEAGPSAPPLPELDLSGPTPPEVAAVFFGVDGAMIPLACFDPAGSAKLAGGKDCLRLVKAGDEVLLGSEQGRALDRVAGPKNALCEVADRPTSLATAALDQGQAYEWAAFPKSLGTKLEQVPAESKSDAAVALSPEEREKLTAAVVARKAAAGKGELLCKQKAELDLDGDGARERFFSVLVAHPGSPDRSLYSGLFLAPGGDLAGLRVVEESTRELDVLTLRGSVDLAGDGKRELWVGLSFDGGAGERILTLAGDKAEPLSKWSCGA